MPAPSANPSEELALELPRSDADDHDEALGVDDVGEDDLDVDEGDDRDDAGASDLDIGDFDTESRDIGARDDETPLFDAVDAPLFDDRSLDRSGDEAVGDVFVSEGLDEPLPGTADDGGVEGTEDGSELDFEGELPALDAGGDEELDMGDLLAEVGLEEDAWEALPDFAIDGALSSIACVDGGVASAGIILALMDRGEAAPRVRALPEACRAIAITPTGLARAGVSGLVVRSGAADVTAWRKPDVSRLGVVGGRLYALASGELARIDDARGHAEIVRADILDLAASAGCLVVVAMTEQGAILACMRGHDGGWEELGAAGALGEIVASGGRLVVNGALAMAAVGAGRVATLAPGARTARTWAIDGCVDGSFRGDGRDAELLVLANDERGAVLTTVGPSGPMTAVPLGVASARAIAWDASRDVALVAGAHGLRGVRPRVRH